MSEPEPAEQQPTTGAEPRPRKGPPMWGVIAFLLLLGAMVIINQVASTGGPEIAWIDGDLDAALAQISPAKPRVFLYLYDPDDATHTRNEREVFTQRWAREPLAGAVCCRIALRRDDLAAIRLRQRFAYQETPLFLLLSKSGTPVSRTEGAVDRLEFFTYIGKPVDDAVLRGSGGVAEERTETE